MGPRLMIVEDEGLVALDLKARLEDFGYGVERPVADGRQAVEEARRSKPDLVLMDIRLGDGMDGIDAADLIRRELRIPVVFVTAHSDESTLARAREAGPFGYILKPIHDQALHVAIDSALRWRQTEGDLRNKIDRLESALAPAVQALSELAPVCVHCGKLRDASGSWLAVEETGTIYNDAKLSHGICPECLEGLYTQPGE